MTQAWQPDGKVVPLTIIEVQDVQVVQAKRVPTSEGEGLNLQLGSGWQKRKRLNRPDAGQFESRGLPLKRYLREFRVSEDAQLPVGMRPAHAPQCPRKLAWDLLGAFL